jgi:hypothetical protein
MRVFQTSRSKLSALYVRDHSTGALYLNSLHAADVQEVRLHIKDKVDLIFLPQNELNLSQEAASLLSRFSPRFIVTNERKQISQARGILESVPDAQILFLEERGAIEFFRSKDSLSWRSVLDRSRSKDSGLEILPAN